jgi:hypothetical protein
MSLEASRSTTKRGSRSCRSVVNPARVSRQTSLAPTRPGGVTAEGSARTRETKIAPSRVTPAKTANTAPGPERPRSTPAASGPSIFPAPSTTPVTTFAAVRSSGVSVSAGISEFCAGLVKVMLIEAIVADAYTTHGAASTNNVTAVAPIATPCTR